jgi:hypothetical protein
MSHFNTAALQNWVPFRLSPDYTTPSCLWLDLKNKPVVEPFFADTINVCRSNQLVKCISSLEMLTEWAPSMDAVNPSGFIFHVSRCGSTLLSQLLSLSSSAIVLSEVPFFDELLRLHYKLPGTDAGKADEWLAAATRFYGQRRNGREEHLFIKADCWHIFFYDRLRKLYPHTPFFLLYRSPDEVLQSQQRRRGMQAVPGLVEPAIMGLDLVEGDPAIYDHDLYFARVLEKIMAEFLQVLVKDNNCHLINYSEGAAAWMNKLAAECGLSVTEPMKEKIGERSLYHGKYPNQVFEKESSPALPAYLETCMQYYNLLEEKRKLIAADR